MATRLRYTHQRPCHIIALWLKSAPDQTMTVKAILAKIKKHPAMNASDSRQEVDANGKALGASYRLGTYIWNLTKDPSHGGSIIQKVINVGPGDENGEGSSEIISFKLMTPERINAAGQNIFFPHQWEAHCRANDIAEGTKQPSLAALAKKWAVEQAENVHVLPEPSTKKDAEVSSKKATQVMAGKKKKSATKKVSGKKFGEQKLLPRLAALAKKFGEEKLLPAPEIENTGSVETEEKVLETA